ncbi:sensor histidine kinase [Haloarcula nitratireducens]|uniref:histidine kinase n=1 Tax=Haloarcula nitratireducens TaxID=2487749 RepID=A0AAW4PC57_9EURY|nr:PAS domain-containing sensor histidine kinase [Halomicroarcula nitratireducens]MBX0295776.1 PAS domain-containing sensor histidine kinase [Halomicroarcula nitratireducens]
MTVENHTGDRTTATESGRVLLLIDHERNRELLANSLAASYDIVVGEGSADVEERFDLCIVDETLFSRCRDRLENRKDDEGATFLPYLLVSSEESSVRNPATWQYVDEVVTTPVAKGVLTARIDGLLERRQLSVALAREKEQSEQRFRTLFETGPDPVFVLGSGGHIRAVNEAFRTLTRSEAGEIAGKRFEEIDAFPPETAATLTESHDGNPVTVSYVTPKGETRYAEVNAAYTPGDGETGEIIGVLRDVTERRRHERQLERQNRRLDEFASMLAHELRNPLGIAQMYLGMARRGEKAAFDQITDALDRMETMIDALLDLARRGETVDDTEQIDLGTVAEEAWGAVETANATLNCADGEPLAADADRLGVVFENLFQNAVEHGGPGVAVEVDSYDGGFYVADDGSGIDADQREIIFERGYSAADDGVGIGLTIVRRISEAHGWRVEVGESDAGGARFDISGVEFR